MGKKIFLIFIFFVSIPMFAQGNLATATKDDFKMLMDYIREEHKEIRAVMREEHKEIRATMREEHRSLRNEQEDMRSYLTSLMIFGFGLSYTALGYAILRQNRRQSLQEFLDSIERADVATKERLKHKLLEVLE